MNSKRAVVTGGDGFLGEALCGVLLEKGFEVISLDNRSRPSHLYLEQNIQGFKTVFADVLDPESFGAYLQKCDLVVHAAAINGTKYFYSKPSDVFEVAFEGTRNVAHAAVNAGVRNLIYFSSSEVYGHPKTFPTSESTAIQIPDIGNDRWSYSGGKLASELYLRYMLSQYFDNLIVVRPHNVFGPNMGSEHVIPELINKIYSWQTNGIPISLQGDGTDTRSFMYISEFKRAMECILNLCISEQNGFDPVNVGVDDERNVNDLLGLMLEMTGSRDAEVIFGDRPAGSVSRRIPDITKLKQVYKFDELKVFKKGLQDTIAWYWRICSESY